MPNVDSQKTNTFSVPFIGFVQARATRLDCLCQFIDARFMHMNAFKSVHVPEDVMF